MRKEVSPLENNGWQFKESSKRSKRNHGDYRMTFSQAGYKFMIAMLWLVVITGAANLLVAIATLIRAL